MSCKIPMSISGPRQITFHCAHLVFCEQSFLHLSGKLFKFVFICQRFSFPKNNWSTDFILDRHTWVKSKSHDVGGTSKQEILHLFFQLCLGNKVQHPSASNTFSCFIKQHERIYYFSPPNALLALERAGWGMVK